MDHGDGWRSRLSSGQERRIPIQGHAGEGQEILRQSAGDNEIGSTFSNESMVALDNLRRKSLLCDAVLRTEDGGAFPVHRAIMTACSSYFKAVFTSSLNASDKRDVLIPGLSKDHLNMIVEYAYTRHINLTDENVTEVLVAADQFDVMGIVKECAEFIRKNVNMENCFSILQFARSCFCTDLEASTFKFIMKNFPAIATKSQEFLEQPVELVCEVLKSETLNIRSEDVAWRAALRWIKHEEGKRKKHVVDLLSNVRLGLMDSDFFVKHVKNHEYVMHDEGCRPLIIETLRFLYDLEMIVEKQEGEMVTPLLAQPRIPNEVMFVIGGWSGGSPTNYIETYDTRADRFVPFDIVDTSGPRAYHGLAVIGTSIYVVGGFDGLVYFNSCRKFDTATRTWSEIAPMNCRRCYVSVVLLDGFLYAMGGYDGHHRQNSCERYNPVTNQWSMVAPMNNQRSDACATTLNGKIVITGGFNGHQCLSSVECYNPAENAWTDIPPMNSLRSGVSCISSCNKIFVFGGFSGLERLATGECYDPDTREWSPIADMYHPRSNFAVEVVDDLIFAIGGFNGVTTISHVECYDWRADVWYGATDMGLYRSALAACVVQDLPNIRGFIHQHRENLLEEKRLKLLTSYGTPPSQSQLSIPFPPPPFRTPLAIEDTPPAPVQATPPVPEDPIPLPPPENNEEEEHVP